MAGSQAELRVRISADVAEIKAGIGLVRGELAKLKTQGNASLGGVGNNFGNSIKNAHRELKAFAATYLSLQGVKLLAGISDEATRLRGRIREAKGDYASILAIAQDTRTGLSATTDLYTRIERSTRSQIKNQGTLLALTKSVNQAIKLSYTGTAQGEAAVLQLGQALSSGKLAGDEFKSIGENAPRLMQAIADGMGVPLEAMKKLASEGKLTTKEVIKALASQAAVLEAEYARVPITIGDALTKVRNSFVDYIGNADQASGASRSLAEAIGFLAKNLGTILDVLIRFATVYAAHLLLFRAAPAVYGAAATALAVYKQQVIATALAQEMGIRTAVTWKTQMRAAAGVVVAAFTGWQIGSFLRDQFEEVELAGIALASGLHVIAVQIKGYFQDAGVRIKLALTDALNGVIGIAGRMNSAIIGVMSKLPGPMGAAYAKIGVASQKFLNGLKLDTRSLATEVGAANRRIATEVGKVRDGYTALADAASEGRRKRAAAGGGIGAEDAVVTEEDPSTENLKAAKAAAESFKLELDIIQRQLKALDQLYQDGQIGVAAYFEKKRELMERDIDVQLAQASAELAITKDLGRRRDIEEDIAILLRNRGEIGPQVARDQAKAEKELTDQLELLRGKLADLSGGFGNEAAAKLQDDYEALLQKLGQSAEGADLAAKIFDIESAKARIDAIKAKAQEVITNLRSGTDYINSQEQLGALGPGEAERQLQALRATSITQLADYKKAMEDALAAAAPGTPQHTAALEGLATINTALADAEAAQHRFRNSIADQAAGALGGFFNDLIDGAKSFKEAFIDMVRSFAAGVAKMIAQELALRAVRSIMGAWGGASPSAKGNVFSGGGMHAFAKGAAFALPGLMAFASGGAFTNGIYTSPQLFQFGAGGQFGVMGEAGPEAVMPLSRGPDGKLGVAAKGGGAQRRQRIVIVDDARQAENFMRGSAMEEAVLYHLGKNPGRVKEIVG